MNAHRRPLSRRRRIGALAFATSALVLATAVPALAHTEVSATDSHALAKNVTLTFESEGEEASAEPENPAPLLKLGPATAGGTPSASPSATPRPESPAPSPDGKKSSKAASSDDGSPWPAVAVIAGVCLVALAGGFVLFQQRRGSGGDE